MKIRQDNPISFAAGAFATTGVFSFVDDRVAVAVTCLVLAVCCACLIAVATMIDDIKERHRRKIFPDYDDAV